MPARETIADFYQQYGHGHPAAGQLAAYRLEDMTSPVSFPHIRRDFYKIKLMCNVQGILSYGAKRVVIQDCALVFANPLIPYSWERTGGSPTGYACLFTEEFSTQQLRTASVAGSPLFRAGGTPVLFPPPALVGRLASLFELILAEMQSDYANKYELLRNYLQIILHESLKLAPAEPFYQPSTSAGRLSALFLELLDRQFPLASPQHTLQFKNANEFARQLSVHTNHLNKSLREITGKTTTEHIAAKQLDEAQALLRHSNWSVAEIGYCLGFEHPANFSNFFRRHTGQTPLHYRQQPHALSQVID